MFELHRSGEVNDARVIEKLDALLATEAAALGETPPSPDAPPAWCAECGEPLRPGQRWCTQCGREATAPVLAPARRTSRRWLAGAGIAILAAAAGAGAAIAAGAIGDDTSTATATATVAAPSATGAVTGGGTAAAPTQATTAPATAPAATAPTQGTTAPAATAASTDVPVWPRDRVGFTVIALAGDRATAARRARELAAAGLEAGIVDGAAHQGLADSLWMTWVGRYGTEAEARAAAGQLRADGTSPGYAQEIVPEP